MGDLQLSSAVSAVVSAFHSAVENVQNIRKKSNRFIKNEKTVKEKLLQETLETAEFHISQRYSKHYQDVGEHFAFGDDIARDRLFRIAILMQSDLVRSLQIAVQVEDANLNLSKLQEDALMFKRDCLDALDGLRDRLLGAPSPTPSSNVLRRPSSESLGTRASSYTMSSSNSGGVINVAMEADDSVKRLDMSPTPEMGRLLSARRALNRQPSNSPDPSRITDLTGLDWPGATPIHPAFRQLSPDHSPTLGEPASPSSGKASPMPGLDEEPSMFGAWSDKIVIDPPIPLPQRSPLRPAPFPPAPTSFPSAPTSYPNTPGYQSAPTSTPVRPAPGPPSPSTNSNRSASSSFSFTRPLSVGPVSPGLMPDNSSAIQSHHNNILAIQSHHNSNSMRLPSFRRHHANSTSSNTSGSGTAPGTPLSLGRPDKGNNYWGFCKSAWAIREDPKKGLSTFDKEDGYYATRKVWLCKTCAFDGPVFQAAGATKKKDYTFDPNIYTAAGGKVRYKWIFLAKSHAKKKSMEMPCYGCLLCVADGKSTGIFGDVETLMRHLLAEHENVRDDVRERCKAVYGRVAGAAEEWDVNIP